MIWRMLEAVNAHGEFCLCVHETTEDEIRERHAHFNMCSEQNCVSAPFIHRHTEHAGLIFKYYFWGLIFTDTSLYCILITCNVRQCDGAGVLFFAEWNLGADSLSGSAEGQALIS